MNVNVRVRGILRELLGIVRDPELIVDEALVDLMWECINVLEYRRGVMPGKKQAPSARGRRPVQT